MVKKAAAADKNPLKIYSVPFSSNPCSSFRPFSICLPQSELQQEVNVLFFSVNPLTFNIMHT
jgi:hypothetical protein